MTIRACRRSARLARELGSSGCRPVARAWLWLLVMRCRVRLVRPDRLLDGGGGAAANGGTGAALRSGSGATLDGGSGAALDGGTGAPTSGACAVAGADRARPASEASPDRLAAAVALAARLSYPRPSCLPRALALRRLLRSAGIPATVRFGVATNAGRLVAHAWVESGGRVVGDRADVAEIFRPLEPWSAATTTAAAFDRGWEPAPPARARPGLDP